MINKFLHRAIRGKLIRLLSRPLMLLPVDMLRSVILFCTCMELLCCGCDIINPAEEIPSYIRIEKINFVVNNPVLQGSSSSEIVDAWVYIDDHPAGVFELPVQLPLLYAGPHTLKVKAGVRNTGFSRIRLSYPFYNFYINDTTFELFRDSVVSVSPVVAYYDDAVFVWLEDFEDVGVAIDSASNSDVDIVRTTDAGDVFEGSGSGAIYLTPDKSFFRGLTTEKFELPQSGKAVFLEMDYRIDTDFQIRLWSNMGSQSDEIELITLTPKTDENGNAQWKKIYIELTNAVLDMPSADNYQVEFIADGGSSGGEIYIDNLKLLHQP